jgi:hypothetical protein
MKTLARRLRLLESRSANHEFCGPSPVGVLRERRRRRLEASGLPCEEPAREQLVFEHGRRPTYAEVPRAARGRRHAESLRAERVEQMLRLVTSRLCNAPVNAWANLSKWSITLQARHIFDVLAVKGFCSTPW